MDKLLDELGKVLQFLLQKTAKRIDGDTLGFKFVAYWVGDIIRIDITPDKPTQED